MNLWEKAKSAMSTKWKPTGGPHRFPDGFTVNTLTGEWSDGDPRLESRDKLLQTSAVHAAVKLIASAVGDLVTNTLYITDRDGKKVTPDSRQQEILDLFKFNPNPHESGHSLVVAAMSDQLLDGNALIGVDRSNQTVHGLYRMIPMDCQTGVNELGVDYYSGPVYGRIGEGMVFNRPNMIHSRYPDLLGGQGHADKKGFVKGPVYTLARTMMINGFLDEFVAQYFTSDANGIRMIFRSTGDVGKEDVMETRKYIRELTKRGGAAPFIEQGIEYIPVNTAPANQDTAAQRQFQIDDIGRIYHIPPALMGIVKSATNTAALNHEFWNRAVKPNVNSLLAAMTMTLLNQPNSRGGKRFRFEVNPSEMLRGDPTSLATTYQCLGDAQRVGVLSPTEWRLANGYPAEMEWTESDDLIYEKLKERQAGIGAGMSISDSGGAEINRTEDESNDSDTDS